MQQYVSEDRTRSPRGIRRAALLLAAAICVLPNFAQAAERPNIVFVLTDDVRWDVFGCMGNTIAQTPHIDALAADGVLFRNAFCTTSICAISRACYMTGQYALRHGITDFQKPLSPEQFAASLPGLLRANGYRTGTNGKWGIGNVMPVEQFDFFRGFPGQGSYFPKGELGKPGKHLTEKLGNEALEFLDGCTAEQPFFFYLCEKAAHCQDADTEWQFQPDPRYNDLFANVTIPKPPTATEAHFAALPEFLQNSEARRRWHWRFKNDELYQKSVKDYYRLITGVDDLIGRIQDKLKQKGFDRNTVIVFSSDNGFYLGEHGLAGKWFMHEESIRLPLVIYDPRLPAKERGRARSEIVLNIDVTPTLLEMADIDVPEGMQGESLLPLIENDETEWRTEFFYEHPFKHAGIPQTEGVRTQDWKYVRYVSVDPLYEELFDLKNDPYEEHNLAGKPEHSSRLADMKQRWQNLRAETE